MAKARNIHDDLTKKANRRLSDVERMRVALQKIADLPLIDSPTFKYKTPPRLRAHRLAVRALGGTPRI